VFALSFAVRTIHAVDLAQLMYTSEQPFNGLTDGYDARAKGILNGEGLLGPYGMDPSQTFALSQAPGYSIYLSAIYAIARRDFFGVQPVQNLLNSLAPVLILLIAGSLLGWRIGIMAGVLCAISHHLSYISNFILPDSLCALPILATVYLLTIVRSTRRVSAPLMIAAGSLIALSSWLRPQSMLLGIFLAAALPLVSVNKQIAVKRGALIALFSLLLVAPITIRNYVVYKAFLPINIGIGLNLWEGLGDGGGDRFGAVRTDNEVAAQEAELYGDSRYAGSMYAPDGISRDRDRVRRSLRIILQHPLWYCGVVLKRAGSMFKYSADAPLVLRQEPEQNRHSEIKKGWEAMAADSRPPRSSFLTWLRIPIRAAQRTAKEWMLGCIVIGLIASRVAAPRRSAFLLLVPLYYLVFQSVMHTEFRYTLPMQHFVFVFAAAGWVLIGSFIVQALRWSATRLRRFPAI
jgi:hypothetical protein